MKARFLFQSKVHFIGIGGIGMSGLAELLKNMGADVSGSDRSENAQTERLKSIGVYVSLGHNEDNLKGVDVVVYSSAIKPENEEYKAAMEMKIPLIPRAEALAELMGLKRGIAVAGTHGKTTTTSLTSSIFINAKSDPTIVVGGRLDIIKSTAQLGSGPWLIAEADESDGSFNRLSPELVIVTNIDNDHLDYYKTFEALKGAFRDFASRIPFYGSAILCGDDQLVRDTFKEFSKRTIYYGFDEENDLRIISLQKGYEVHYLGEKLGELHIPMPGRHNALNALAAVAAGLEAGIDFQTCADGIKQFQGVDRRFQHKGSFLEMDFYDDYGHHPTEIKAVLSGIKGRYPDRRLVTLFQPHRFSRTRNCWDDFKNCFEDTDKLLMMDIYPAGESPLKGVNSESLVQFVDHKDKEHFPIKDATQFPVLFEKLDKGDIFLSLGAGDVYRWGDQFIEYIKGES